MKCGAQCSCARGAYASGYGVRHTILFLFRFSRTGAPTPPYAVVNMFFLCVASRLAPFAAAPFAAASREPLVHAIAWQNSCTAVAIFSSVHSACASHRVRHV